MGGDYSWAERRPRQSQPAGHERHSQIVLTSTDGQREHAVAGVGDYASRASNSAQFGDGGRRLYLLGLDRRTMDVLDVESGTRERTITFDVPAGDQVEGFAVAPDGTRVLLTTGGNRGDLWMVEGFARPAASWRRWFSHWQPQHERRVAGQPAPGD
jgi:hypothetical protein